ncbi:hypothetical protein J6590_045739 [Homalodisca vitripennis]|nr:hypothetical protein J6590_045739 [Homalodisca vitripennis]
MVTKKRDSRSHSVMVFDTDCTELTSRVAGGMRPPLELVARLLSEDRNGPQSSRLSVNGFGPVRTCGGGVRDGYADRRRRLDGYL